jgi:hypothetical protein
MTGPNFQTFKQPTTVRGLLLRGVATTVAIAFVGCQPTRTGVQPIATTDDGLFAATVASLADSMHAIGEMTGTAVRGIPLRIDPRPLRVPSTSSSDDLERLAEILDVGLDSLDAGSRSNRVATLRASGFAIGDLAAVDGCPPAMVSPPGTSPIKPPPPPCALAPAAVAGIGVQKQTTRDATVRIVILVLVPYKQEFSADYVFARDRTWRLVGQSPWTIAE